MKSFLAFFVAMGIIVTQSDASCVYSFQNPKRTYRGCILNGKLYPFGFIERTESCYECTCDKAGALCCPLFHTPFGYDKENCKVVFNKKRCDYDVVQKDDPSKECSSIYDRVG